MRFRRKKENGNGQTLDVQFQAYSFEFFEVEKLRFAQVKESAKLEAKRRRGSEYTR
jgi:hypothetical protein